MNRQVVLGRVVVVAGSGDRLEPVCRHLVSDGAMVAYVSKTVDRELTASLIFRADPGDPSVWPRIRMHIEQQLGPVDAVIVDEAAADVLLPFFQSDLSRRGHGGVVIVGSTDTDGDVLSRLADTQRVEPA
jgi:hypothetical protein